MTNPKAKRIPDEDWQTHKDTLGHLWLEKNTRLVGPESVMEIMESRYNFAPSKSQYEAQFKKWKWSKNQKNDDWERLAGVMYQRERQKKKSDVYINGTLQSRARVQKRIAPHALSIPQRLSSGLNLRLPKYMTILSPTLDKTQWVTSGLPFDAIEKLLHIGTDESSHRILSSPNPSGGPGLLQSSLTVLDRLDPVEQAGSPLIEASNMREGDVSADAVTTVSETFKPGTSMGLDFTALKSVLPQSNYEENVLHPLVDNPSTREFEIPGYRQVLFSLANNFAGLDGADMSKVVRFLQKGTSQEVLQLICSDSSYSSRALAQSVLQGAVELGDARLVDLVLSEKSTGIDINRMWFHIEGERYTPIERASLLRHQEVIKILLKHKSDVNRTCPGRDHDNGALECAVGVFGEYKRVDPEIYRELLNAGGDLSKDALWKLIRFQDGEFVGLIMSANAHKNANTWSKWGAFGGAIAFLDDPEAMAVIRVMLAVGADLNLRPKEQPYLSRCPRRVIDAAARRGNVEMIEILLNSGARMTNRTLSFAVVSGNHDLMRMLLDRGADVNSHHHSSSESLTTPLAEAIRLQDTETIELLKLYDIFRLDDRDQLSAAINAASEVGDIPFIKYLVQLGGQARTAEMGYALTIAIKEGQDEAATILIDADADLHIYNVNPDGIGPPLYEALNRHNAVLVHLILEAGANPNVECSGRGGLCHAIEWGNSSIVETLILAGADPNDFGSEDNTPLLLAVKEQDRALVQLLLDVGADVNLCGTLDSITPLEVALILMDIGMACYLLDRGADLLEKPIVGEAMAESPELFELLLERQRIRCPMGKANFGCNALLQAIGLGDEHAIKIMLERGLDVNSLTSVPDGNEYGNRESPFGHALANSTVDVIEMFLQKGCNPDRIVYEHNINSEEISYRTTGFLVAITTRNLSKAKLLHRYGADVNFPTGMRVKHTPLQAAAAVGSTDIVELLIRLGGEVNAPAARRGGGTALQLAAIGGYIPVTCLLLEFHADPNAPAARVDGRTALEGAAEHGRLDMLQLLLNAGAGNGGQDKGQFTRAIALASDQGFNHITDFLEDYLRQNRQEEELATLAAPIDDGFGTWGFDWGTDDIDMDS